MIIAFHIYGFDVRGTNIALYDYSKYNQILLNNTSIIVSPFKNINNNDLKVVNKFKKMFKIFYYDNDNDNNSLINILKNEKCDILYTIKYGLRDPYDIDPESNIKYCVHCVFDMSSPHGDIYAGVSKTIADKYNQPLYVPHIVDIVHTNDNMRKILNIPEDSIVFGRMGGAEVFDLEFVHFTINEIVKTYTNIYFIFVNTNRFNFTNSPYIIHLNSIADIHIKCSFINTCNAMIHAQSLGETFGLAIAEFSALNKPVITHNAGWNQEHLHLLGDKAIKYNNQNDLYYILTNFKKYLQTEKSHITDFNCYSEYSPVNVMKKFKEVFIDG